MNNLNNLGIQVLIAHYKIEKEHKSLRSFRHCSIG